MEKISGIIPASNRVKAVDVAASGPVRPGTPGFGRASGSNGIKSSLKRSTIASGVDVGRLQMERDRSVMSKRAREAQIAKRMSDDFFMNKMHKNDLKMKSIENGIDSKRVAQDLQQHLNTSLHDIRAERAERVPQKGTQIDRKV